MRLLAALVVALTAIAASSGVAAPSVPTKVERRSPTGHDVGIGALYAPTSLHDYHGADAIVVTADFGLRDGRAGL